MIIMSGACGPIIINSSSDDPEIYWDDDLTNLDDVFKTKNEQAIIKYIKKAKKIDSAELYNVRFLHEAAKWGYVDVTDCLLDYAAQNENIDYDEYINYTDENYADEGGSALYKSFMTGHDKEVIFLAENGAETYCLESGESIISLLSEDKKNDSLRDALLKIEEEADHLELKDTKETAHIVCGMTSTIAGLAILGTLLKCYDVLPELVVEDFRGNENVISGAIGVVWGGIVGTYQCGLHYAKNKFKKREAHRANIKAEVAKNHQKGR